MLGRTKYIVTAKSFDYICEDNNNEKPLNSDTIIMFTYFLPFQFCQQFNCMYL